MKKVYIYGDEKILVNYKNAIELCGGEPFFSTTPSRSQDCDALLLAGGGDIHPALYGQELYDCNNIDMKRDKDETELIRAFILTGRPILGICRGIQILNVALGGTLIQDVENTERHQYDAVTGDRVHCVTAHKNSFLEMLYGDSFVVNSAHHQAIDSPAKGLNISALSCDGVIEAVENKQKKLYAVQFHPERMAFKNKRNDTVDGRCIFDFFLRLS